MTALAALVSTGDVVVLSGAGLSTESGIPDYRGRSAAALQRRSPMTHDMFVGDPVARRRYWARSHLGWPLLSRAIPNSGHHAVTRLEQRGLVRATITQNVDGLHAAAGTRTVVDLHGRLDRVVCLGCGAPCSRAGVAERLSAANRGWEAQRSHVNPDGDAEVPEDVLDGFVVVDCSQCGGVLMPDVVYFGAAVPADRVAAAYSHVDAAAMILVLGSSLTVFSGRRFVVHAAKAGHPVAIINEGPTRCDDRAALKLDAPLGSTLCELVDVLGR